MILWKMKRRNKKGKAEKRKNKPPRFPVRHTMPLQNIFKFEKGKKSSVEEKLEIAMK